MSLMTALSSGASGLEGNSTELTVVGDNIANANTIGFKGSRTVFSDAIAQQLVGGTPNGGGQRGMGVKMLMVQRILSQGAFTNTGNATDLAIEGNGYFVLRGNHNGTVGTFYTRAGQFTVDQTGYLVNLEGLKVQGYTADSAGVINSATIGDMQVGNASAPPRATSSVTVRGNLQADATPPAAWNINSAGATSNFSVTVNVYDSLGKPAQIDVYFRKTANAGEWEWHALSDGKNITGGTSGQAFQVGNGMLTFNASGALVTKTEAVDFDPIGAVQNQALTFNFGTASATGGLDGLTQFAAPSAASFLSQVGFTSGSLSRINIDAKGQVVGSFTNGQTRTLGQVVLGNFEAPDNLSRVGANLYTENTGSGTATIGAPATADRGGVVSGALEQSNVDIAQEFIRMISAQRGFQANSKTLTTADQLLAELMTIRR